MFKKLVPDARFDRLDTNRTLLTSAETVTIKPYEAQVIHTGLYTYEPLILSFQNGNGKLDMCTLLTVALPDMEEVKVTVLNRGTVPVTIVPGEWLVVARRLGAAEPLDVDI
jgi:hypothetical protein